MSSEFTNKALNRPRYSKALVAFLAAEGLPSGSFYAALHAFLHEKDKELLPSSVIRLFAALYPLGKALHDSPLAAVSYTDLRDYVDGLYRRYKPGTIKPIVGNIKQFFKWAKKRRYIKRNPAKRLKKPSRRTLARTAKPKAVSEAAIQQVITYLVGRLTPLVYRGLFGLCTDATVWGYEDQERIRDLFLITFIYETGCRAGELWRLSTRAMDEACSESGPVYEVVSTGKTGDNLLRFTVATAELWQIWQMVRPSGCEDFAVVAWDRDTPPRPMKTATIGKAIARRCKQASVQPAFRSHALRHTKIKRSKKLFGLEITSRLIGHSGLDITSGYGNDEDVDERIIEAAEKTGLPYRLFASG